MTRKTLRPPLRVRALDTNRCRMKDREKRRHVTHEHSGSSGRASSRCSALRMASFPCEVKTVPLRALRVGITQSKRSKPIATNRTSSSGVPTPIR